ncbi:hypothetical protein AC579_3992 [Pseudocercospora musae]|uniref:RRM domain-containing protein n=1 Tax=Pseudocercospora musae TaxID=113226 RepID=A0A139IIC2_9PEZI|nr:hypothetical protein AC579_3992 [Pseudocercospora musae]
MATDNLNQLVMTLLALSSGLGGQTASQVRDEIAKIPAALYSERKETDESIAALRNETREAARTIDTLRRENEHLKEAYALLEMPVAHMLPEPQTANTPHADATPSRGSKGASHPPSEERCPPEAPAAMRKRFSTSLTYDGDLGSESSDRTPKAPDGSTTLMPSGRRVWVGGLARDTDEATLRRFFGDFEWWDDRDAHTTHFHGADFEYSLSIAFHTTASKNRIAFVILPTAADASRAVQQLNNKRLLDRTMSVKHAIPKGKISSETADGSDMLGDGDFQFRGRSSTSAMELFPGFAERSQENPAKRVKISPP